MILTSRATDRTKPISLNPIKPRRVSDQVFEQLRELIARGRIKPGERLMPERELATSLRVSRTTVREALNKMVVMGILEQKQGQGTFVRTLDRSTPNSFLGLLGAEEATLIDLLDVRLGLECNAARFAALRATAADLHILERHLAEMSTAVNTGHTGAEADGAFHMAIAEASHNPLQILLMRQFYDFMSLGIERNLSLLYESANSIGAVAHQHEQIVAGIRQRNPEAAVTAVQMHIEKVRERLQEDLPEV